MLRALCHDTSFLGTFFCTELRSNRLAVSCSEEVSHLTVRTIRAGTSVSTRLEVGRITHPIEILRRVTASISFSSSPVESTLVLICMSQGMLHESVAGTFDPAVFWILGFPLHAHDFQSARFLCGLMNFERARNLRYAFSLVWEHGP